MVTEPATTLYRPVGKKELDLIAESGFRSFPPRLAGQPFFYPVLTEDYARRIARDWNTRDEASGFLGYVLEFQVKTPWLAGYEIQTAGSSKEQEYWIPAHELPDFNANIVGPIKVIAEFRGTEAKQSVA